MRLGVLSDVHGNLDALDAALAFLEGQRLNGYLCAGDLVGYGPYPNECVRRVLALRAPCVAGNHDLIALGRLGDERCAALARESLGWTRSVLDDDARELLGGLPLGVERDGVAVRHGSVTDPREYVLGADRARACLDELAEAAPGAHVLVLGHTHRAMAVGRRRGMLLREATGEVALEPGEPIVLNPGAVGQSRSRDARARVMVLDLTERVARFHAVGYDVQACRRALRDRGLPEESCHVPPSRWEEAVGAVKRRVVRARTARMRRWSSSPRGPGPARR
jgi:predicted phosphodiesterase